MNIEELKQILLDSHDADELVDLLCISPEELLERFEDKLLENIYKFDYEENYQEDQEEETFGG